MTILRPQDIHVLIFPDGQPHVSITKPCYDNIDLTWSVRNPSELFQLAQITDIVRYQGGTPYRLRIPYLMGGRSDRRPLSGNESFDLKATTKIINACNWKHVILFDPHSDVSTALINNSFVRSNTKLISEYKQLDPVLIIPDTGAAKKVYPQFIETVQCIKHRDPATGKIELKVLEAEKCRDRNCVIIDDICDGGATFLTIAQKIKPKHMTLIVSHGIFSKGFDELSIYFDKIITSDSYKHHFHPSVQTIPTGSFL